MDDLDQSDERRAAQAEAIFAAIREGTFQVMGGGLGPQVASIYGEVFRGQVLTPAKERGGDVQLDQYRAVMEEAYYLFGHSMFIIGALVQHIANAEGQGLEGVFDIARRAMSA